MTEPMNEENNGLTEALAREIVTAGPHYMDGLEAQQTSLFAKGFLKGVEAERLKHLERIAQEKALLEQEKNKAHFICRAHDHEGCMFCEEDIRQMKGALEAADRLVSRLEEQEDLPGDIELLVDECRAARAKTFPTGNNQSETETKSGSIPEREQDK